MENNNPVSILLNVIRHYLIRRSKIIFSLARTCEQKILKIELLGLMREYSKIYMTGKLKHVIKDILKNKNYLEILKKYGIINIVIEEKNENGYILVDIEQIEKTLIKEKT